MAKPRHVQKMRCGGWLSPRRAQKSRCGGAGPPISSTSAPFSCLEGHRSSASMRFLDMSSCAKSATTRFLHTRPLAQSAKTRFLHTNAISSLCNLVASRGLGASRTHLFVLRDFARIRRKECENGGWRFPDARAHRARGFAHRAHYAFRAHREPLRGKFAKGEN